MGTGGSTLEKFFKKSQKFGNKSEEFIDPPPLKKFRGLFRQIDSQNFFDPPPLPFTTLPIYDWVQKSTDARTHRVTCIVIIIWQNPLLIMSFMDSSLRVQKLSKLAPWRNNETPKHFGNPFTKSWQEKGGYTEKAYFCQNEHYMSEKFKVLRHEQQGGHISYPCSDVLWSTSDALLSSPHKDFNHIRY